MILSGGRWLALASLILVLPEMGWAAPLKLLSYQGRVTDANGQPPANFSDYKMQFRIYSTKADCDGDTGINLLWTEVDDGGVGNPAAVAVTNGLFSVVLGTDSDVPLSMNFDSDYWLGVKVDTDHDGLLTDETQFNPCDRLTTAPYAINSINTDSCNTDATCETAALSTTGNATIGGRVDVNATGSSFLGRIGVEGDTGIACNPGTGSSGIWYADAGDCGSVFAGINSATNGSESWGIWIGGNWDWTVDVNGNVTQGGNLSLANTKYIEFAGNTLGADASRLYTGASNRLLVRAEDTDNVAQFASYGLYLPLDPGVSLYVGGDIRLGYASGADNDAIQFDDGTKTLTWNDATGRFDFNADVTAPTFVGALTGTADNAKACSGDPTCETNAISASGAISNTSTITTPGYISITGAQDASGNLRFSTANPYISASSYFIAPGGAYFNSGTVYVENALMARNYVQNDGATNGGAVRIADPLNVDGEVLAPAFRAPAAGFSTGSALDLGDVAVDYPGNAGWTATWNSNILLSGMNSSSISFHDSGLRVDTLRVAGGTFYIGENVGWGVANLDVKGTIKEGGNRIAKCTSVGVSNGVSNWCPAAGWFAASFVNTSGTNCITPYEGIQMGWGWAHQVNLDLTDCFTGSLFCCTKY